MKHPFCLVAYFTNGVVIIQLFRIFLRLISFLIHGKLMSDFFFILILSNIRKNCSLTRFCASG